MQESAPSTPAPVAADNKKAITKTATSVLCFVIAFLLSAVTGGYWGLILVHLLFLHLFSEEKTISV